MKKLTNDTKITFLANFSVLTMDDKIKPKALAM